jgi:metallo-beta-lactamase family protein
MITHKQSPVPTSQGEAAITFWGATQAVSGSMHILEVGNRKLLLDCGLYQGRREEARQRNSRFPFHPKQIDAVLLTHAHIDHSGNLPNLVRQGFSGPIYCTPATRDLLAIMLADSARIQEEDAAHLNIIRNYAEPWVQPLYTQADVDDTLRQCVPISYEKPKDIFDEVRVTMYDAGHVIGSTMLHFRLRTADGRHRTLTYTGDLGRRGVPILKPAAPVPPADLIVCESTYGGRVHEPMDQTAEKLWAAINRTYQRGGKVLIPAFSLGRTQLIVHFLREGIRRGKIPPEPIYVDSPLAADIADVYRNHPECLDPELVKSLRDDPEFLGSDMVHYVRNFEESLHLAKRPGSAVLIAASGMCDAGRILHHLKHTVFDPRCTVILVSYQAPGTVGRRLIERGPTVRFLGKDWNKWIDVVHLDGFSGHADRNDFREIFTPLAGKVQRVRLIHGEPEQAESLLTMLREMGFSDVAIPEPGDRVVI